MGATGEVVLRGGGESSGSRGEVGAKKDGLDDGQEGEKAEQRKEGLATEEGKRRAEWHEGSYVRAESALFESTNTEQLPTSSVVLLELPCEDQHDNGEGEGHGSHPVPHDQSSKRRP